MREHGRPARRARRGQLYPAVSFEVFEGQEENSPISVNFDNETFMYAGFLADLSRHVGIKSELKLALSETFRQRMIQTSNTSATFLISRDESWCG